MTTEKKNNWQITGIILIIISVILAVATGFLIFQSVNQQSQINDLENKIKQVNDGKSELGSDDDVTTKYSSYTTKLGLSFDYPEGWSIKADEEEHNSLTTITTKNGYRLFLLEDISGIGGICDPDNSPSITVHKEAKSMIDGLSVISYNQTAILAPDETRFEFHIELSKYSGRYDAPVNRCSDLGMYNWNIGGYVYDKNFSFANFSVRDSIYTDKQPDSSEYTEIVKMLGSLHKK